MRKLLITIFFFYCSLSIAGDMEIFKLNKPMQCSKRELLMDYIINDYKEKPVLILQEASTYTHIALYRNDDTGTWSLIQYDDVTGCFLGFGTVEKTI